MGLGVGPKEAKAKDQREMRTPPLLLGIPHFCSLISHFRVPTGDQNYTQDIRAGWTTGVLLTKHLGWFWGAEVGVSQIHGRTLA